MTAKTVSALLLSAALIMTACAPGGERETATVTMAPATPPPATDTDPVPTQTVEIGEERSPNEGGVLTDPDGGGVDSTETGTATATQTAPK
ncbi:MAG: hypothetical protein ACYC7A_09260 [Thermoanaerobaculia bacterium]